MEKSVHFYSEGFKLAAVMYVPDDYQPGQKRPGIVFCHGYGGTKEIELPMLGYRFMEAGYVSLAFDYRGSGESEGERWRLMMTEQVIDSRNAITFLENQPEVDPDKIGLFGTGCGGGVAIVTGAEDKRPKCVVSNVGFGDGGRMLSSNLRYWEWARLLEWIDEDRVNRVMTGKSKRFFPEEIMPLDPYSDSIVKQAREAGLLHKEEVKYPLDAIECKIHFKPEEVVDRISPRPLLLIHGDADVWVPLSEAQSLYEKAKEPKKLVVLPGVRHIDIYLDPAIEEVIKNSLDWYNTYIPVD